MPAEVLLDALELETETLEAEFQPAGANPAYPYPLLKRTGRSAVMSFQAVILENDCLEATLLPDLGGRLIGLRDKRTGTEAIPLPKKLHLADGGPRGVWCAQGIQIGVGEFPRRNGLGPMERMEMHPEDEDGAAMAIFHELSLGHRLGIHLAWSLAPDSPWLQLSVSIQNRALAPVVIDAGLMAETLGAGWILDRTTGNGVLVQAEAGGFTFIDAGLAALDGVVLQPHQVETFRCRLAPIGGLRQIDAASNGVAIGVGAFIEAAAVEEVGPVKLFVQLESGETLEAPADLGPGRGFSVPASDLPGKVVALLVRNAEGADLVSWPAAPNDQPDAGRSMPLPDLHSWLDGEGDVVRLARHMEGKAPAHLVRGLRAMGAKAWGEAFEAFDTALAFNAEDALVWWLKALARRLSGEELGEDAPELPNAHFLAPLEPVLRAEAFLSQPQIHGKEPNPLVKPMANNPDAQLEIVHLLLEAGQFEEASRWIDECLRHREEPMLRVMLAWMLSTRSRMDAEAAQHLVAAEKSPFEPPFPWRPYEVQAVEELSEGLGRGSERLARLRALV